MLNTTKQCFSKAIATKNVRNQYDFYQKYANMLPESWNSRVFLPGLFATAMKNTINYSIRFTIFRTLKQHFEETIKVEEMKGEKYRFSTFF